MNVSSAIWIVMLNLIRQVRLAASARTSIVWVASNRSLKELEIKKTPTVEERQQTKDKSIKSTLSTNIKHSKRQTVKHKTFEFVKFSSLNQNKESASVLGGY